MTVAVVTGAAAGIGAAIAEQLARDGYTVVAADRDEAALDEAVARLTADGLIAHGVIADVTISDQVSELFDRAAAHGTVSVAVNNAGSTTTKASLHEISDAEWRAAFDACVRPVVLCSRAALRQMLAADCGAIVSIASIHQRIAAPGLAAYTAAKGAIVALSKQLAVDYGSRGIRSNVVSPGWIRTPATESRLSGPADEDALLAGTAAPQLGEPSDIAAAVAYLASPAAQFVNGAELVVDGASSLITGIHALRTTHHGLLRRSE